MNKGLPKVSILMPVYNGETYLKNSVDSILNQTFTDFEYILIDDGSTDSTWLILSEYANRDERIKLFKNEVNLGLVKSLNKGLHLARGEHIARQDADDVALPERLELQTRFLESHPEVGGLGTSVEIIDERGKTVRKEILPEDRDSLQGLLLVNNFMHHSTMMVRRSLMEVLGGYDESMLHAEDYDLWWRLSCISDLATLPDTLVKRRLDNSPRISKVYREQQLETGLRISFQAVLHRLGESSKTLNKEAYERFWWSYLSLLDREAYQRFRLAKQGDRARLGWQDIQNLQPLWDLLANYPTVWGSRLRRLAYSLLQSKQTLSGMQLLRVLALQFQIPIEWKPLVKASLKPYLPGGIKQLGKIRE